MKVFKISLCFLIILSFVSCGRNEFCNSYSFIDNYNKVSLQPIGPSDFIFNNPQSSQYTAVIGSINEEILLSLNCQSDDNIYEVKVSLVKNKTTSPNASQTDKFKEVVKNSLFAFCGFEEMQCEEIITSFELNNNETFYKEGELTLKRNNYYFVYYSTQIISQIMIYNTYLHEIEPTEKPVSKPYYAEDFIIKEKETP